MHTLCRGRLAEWVIRKKMKLSINIFCYFRSVKSPYVSVEFSSSMAKKHSPILASTDWLDVCCRSAVTSGNVARLRGIRVCVWYRIRGGRYIRETSLCRYRSQLFVFIDDRASQRHRPTHTHTLTYTATCYRCLQQNLALSLKQRVQLLCCL